MTTAVVNIHHDAFDVYIGRAGKDRDGYFGNPFRLSRSESRDAAIDKFRDYFFKRVDADPEFRRRVLELVGKRLG